MNEFVERAGWIMRELFAPKVQEVNCRFNEIGGRFDSIEQKLRSFEQLSEGIEKRLSAVNERSAKIEQNLNGIETTRGIGGHQRTQNGSQGVLLNLTWEKDEREQLCPRLCFI